MVEILTPHFKGQSMGTGQCNTKQCNAQLRDLITEGKTTPGFLVSHELDLADAPRILIKAAVGSR